MCIRDSSGPPAVVPERGVRCVDEDTRLENFDVCIKYTGTCTLRDRVHFTEKFSTGNYIAVVWVDPGEAPPPILAALMRPDRTTTQLRIIPEIYSRSVRSPKYHTQYF